MNASLSLRGSNAVDGVGGGVVVSRSDEVQPGETMTGRFVVMAAAAATSLLIT